MQYDLNIPYNATDFSGSLRATFSRACEFGYDAFAINNVIEAEQIIQKDEKGGKQKASNFITELLQPPQVDEEVLLSEFARDLLAVRGRKPRILKRLTIVIRDPDLFVRFTSVAKRIYDLYDIVAVQPLTDRALQCACERWPIDIISLRLNEPLSFLIQPQRVRAALKRGVYFEVPYAAMLRDASVRRIVMTNANLLVAATKSKGIVFSSEAQNPFEIRAAQDVAALARMLGMHAHRSTHVTAVNCTNVVLHGETRTRTVRGAMIVKFEGAPSNVGADVEMQAEANETTAAENEVKSDVNKQGSAACTPLAADIQSQTDVPLDDSVSAASRIRAILERVERECASRGKRRNKMKYERRKNKTTQPQRAGTSNSAKTGNEAKNRSKEEKAARTASDAEEVEKGAERDAANKKRKLHN